MAKDNDSHVRVGQYGELVRLFEETSFALEVGDRSVAILLNGLDLDLLPAHDGLWSHEAIRRQAGGESEIERGLESNKPDNSGQGVSTLELEAKFVPYRDRQ